MRLHARHRWISFLGLLAMLSALAVAPASSFAAVSHIAMPHTGMAQAGTVHQTQSDHVGASVVDRSMPCKSCPQCPKRCSDQASCFVKCLQNTSLAPPVVDGTGRIIVRNAVWPRRVAAVRATALPPLLRPPSL